MTQHITVKGDGRTKKEVLTRKWYVAGGPMQASLHVLIHSKIVFGWKNPGQRASMQSGLMGAVTVR